MKDDEQINFDADAVNAPPLVEEEPDWTPPTDADYAASAPPTAEQQDAKIAAAEAAAHAKNKKEFDRKMAAMEEADGKSEREPTSGDAEPIGGPADPPKKKRGRPRKENETEAVEVAPAVQRSIEEAWARLPACAEAVIEQRTTKIRDENGDVKARKIDVLGAAEDLGAQLGMKFLRHPDADPNGDELRKGGKFLMKQDGHWDEPALTIMLRDLLLVTGCSTAIGQGSQLKSIRARMAETLLAGTLGDADAVIPPERLPGEGVKNPIKPMVLDADGKAVSLAEGECGQWAEQHDDHPLLKRLAVKHDPTATCPEWDEKIHWAMQNKEGTRTTSPDGGEVRLRVQFLEELLAAGLYNGQHGNEFQEWAFFSGTGGNFKGGCLDAVVDGVYGAFGRRMKSGPFFQSKNSGDEKVGELQTLEGAWLAVIGESPKFKVWRSETMKDATGAPKLTVRPMGKPERDIVNSWFLIAQGNTMPKSPDSSYGWTRRRHVLLFENQVSKEQQDPKLARRLLKEAPGIFNRLLQALERIYAKGGLVPPADVAAQQEAYEQHEATQITRFADQYLIPDRDHVEDARVAYDNFLVFKAIDDQIPLEKVLEAARARGGGPKFPAFRDELGTKLGAGKVEQDGTGVWKLRGYKVIEVEGDVPQMPATASTHPSATAPYDDGSGAANKTEKVSRDEPKEDLPQW